MESPHHTRSASVSEIEICNGWEPWSSLCVTLMPIIQRRRQPPNVVRVFLIDSAVLRLLWMTHTTVGYLLRSPGREEWLCCFNQLGSKTCEFIFRDRPGILES